MGARSHLAESIAKPRRCTQRCGDLSGGAAGCPRCIGRRSCRSVSRRRIGRLRRRRGALPGSPGQRRSCGSSATTYRRKSRRVFSLRTARRLAGTWRLTNGDGWTPHNALDCDALICRNGASGGPLHRDGHDRGGETPLSAAPRDGRGGGELALSLATVRLPITLRTHRGRGDGGGGVGATR